MAQSLNALAVGALVKDTGTLYNGKPIIWKIADKGHTGYPSGAVTLITERIISLKCVDAIESGNSDGNRRSYGNNSWTLSNLRQWLNSQAAAGKWYSAQHGADAAPTNANVWSNYNEYDAEAGFLAGFSANFVAALLTTTHTVGKATVDGGGTESCTDKIFLATCTEVGLSGDVTAGSKLALFSDDSSRLAYPTAEAVSKSEYTNGGFNVNSPWWWWLADAYASYSYDVRGVHSSGAMNWNGACNGDYGVRPLCNLSSGILVSDSPDSDGAYTIIWNRAPSKPSSITVPSNVRGGESLSIGWGASTDEDGNLSGYILERQVNGGAWAQVYKGINRSYTDAITFGWTSIAYRVKAYDSAGAESAYNTSATRTYTFTKNETEIELTLATPLTADDMVTKGIMSVVRQIPAGAKFTVEVCNNGNDASPTWEDVTQNVVSGSKFFLSNTTKTASAWGYNFRIKVKRGTATGDCFITSAGGNFE